MLSMKQLLVTLVCTLTFMASAQTTQAVVDIQTQPGVTQRMIVLTPPNPKAAVVLLAGGHGGLQIQPGGSMKWGNTNFLVRTRQLFAEQGLVVAVVDAPSDRQSMPYLSGFRQTAEHAGNIKAVVAWLRQNAKVPVWLVGTSRGTQSVAYLATELSGVEGPDGVVLTSSIVTDERSRSVTAMPLEKIRIPVLVVHHEQDGCSLCQFSETPALMAKLVNTTRRELLSFKGGQNTGDPCAEFAYHGFNGLESDVVQQVARWVLAP